MKYKTPLRYPGGKSKAMNKMAPYFPPKDSVKHYREPFLGGGSVALWMTQNYNPETVWVNDLYWSLYNFWVNLRDHGDTISDALIETKNNYNTPDKARELFETAKKELSDKDATPIEKAINFWIVNKCSFSDGGNNRISGCVTCSSRSVIREKKVYCSPITETNLPVFTSSNDDE